MNGFEMFFILVVGVVGVITFVNKTAVLSREKESKIERDAYARVQHQVTEDEKWELYKEALAETVAVYHEELRLHGASALVELVINDRKAVLNDTVFETTRLRGKKNG